MLCNGALVGITDERLKLLVARTKAKIVKIQEKSIGKRSLLWSLILHVFPEKSADEKMEMLVELMGKAKVKEVVPNEIIDQALNAMPHEEVKADFESLRNSVDKAMMSEKFKAEVTRKVGVRGEREHSTPEAIKNLRPQWKQCVLCMDVGLSSFEAYYPAGRPTKSVSMKWKKSGDDQGQDNARSKLFALNYCLEFLWRNHEEKGRDTGQSYVHWSFFVCYTYIDESSYYFNSILAAVQSKDCSQKPDPARVETALAEAFACQNKEEGFLANYCH